LIRSKENGFYSLISDKTSDFAGRSWLFTKIKSWLEETNGPRYFLITGKAGTGKSAISARLWQISEGEVNDGNLEKGFLTAIHVCSHRDAKSLSSIAFSESLANQLSERYEAFRNQLIEISARYVKNLNIDVSQKNIQAERVSGPSVTVKVTGSPDPNYIFQTLIWNPLEKIIQGSSNIKIVFLIDALDESLTILDSNSIFSLISNVETLPSNVRFLVTSRDNDYIKDRLSHNGIVLSLSEEYYEKNNEDIQEFINLRIKYEPKLSNHYQGFIQDLTRKAEDNFMYATFVLNAIIEDKLELTKESLLSIPPLLGGLYHEFLVGIRDNNPEKWNNELKLILAVLSVAYKGLNQGQLAFLTRIDPLKIYNDMLELKSFIRFTNTNDEYQSASKSEIEYKLYHKSLTDFLFQNTYRSKNQNGVEYIKDNLFYVEQQDAHRTIASKYYSDISKSIDMRLLHNDEYALRYLSYHLVELANYRDFEGISWYEQLLRLAKDDKFEIEQQDYFTLEPELNLIVKKQAFTCALNNDDNTSSIKLLFEYSDKTKSLASESPLGVLRTIGDRIEDKGKNEAILRKSWILADYSDPQVTDLWYLLMSWTLDRRKSELEAKKTLEQLNRKKKVFPHSRIVTFVIASLFGKYEEVSKLFDDANVNSLEIFEYLIKDKKISGAIEISTHIIDPYDKSIALTQIARTIEPIDKVKAENLLCQAIQCLDKIYYTEDKSKGLFQIARRIVSINSNKRQTLLDQAFNMVSNVYDPFKLINTFFQVGQVIGAGNFDQAESIAHSIDYHFYQIDESYLLINIAEAIAPSDFDRAISIADKINDSYQKSIALSKIAQTLTPSDEDKAEKLLEKIIPIIEELEESDNVNNEPIILSNIAQALGDINQDRTKELLERTLRIVSKLNNFGQSEVMCKIAEGLLPIDNDMAENLLEKSIYLAQKSSDSEYKSMALCDIAIALSSTDLDGALSIVKKINHTYYKSEALSNIAQAFVDHNFDKAIDLFKRIDDNYRPSNVLSKSAQALAVTDYDKAHCLSDLIIDTYYKCEALSNIAKVIATTDKDKDKAEKLVEEAISIVDKVDMDRLPKVISAIGQTLPYLKCDASERLLERILPLINNAWMPDEARSLLAVALAPADKNKAERLRGQSISLAEKIENNDKKSVTFCGIAVAFAANDIEDAISIVEKINHNYHKSMALSQIAQTLTPSDKDNAEKLLKRALSLVGMMDAHSSYERSHSLSNIAQTIGSMDINNDDVKNLLERTIDLAYSIDQADSRYIALSNIAEAIAPSDFDRAISIADKINDSYQKSIALSKIAQTLTPSDKDNAEKLLEKITYDMKLDSKSLSKIAQAFVTSDKDKAENLLGKAIVLAKSELIPNPVGSPQIESKIISEIAQVIANSNFDPDVTIKILTNANSEQLYEIAKYLLNVPVNIWIYITNRLMIYPDMIIPICSLICLRKLPQIRELVNLVKDYL